MKPPLIQPFADLRLLGELGDAVAVEHQTAEARRWAHGGDRRELAVRPVELEQRRQIHVGHAVAVGEHERLVAERLRSRYTRPPVMLAAPVSTRWTTHGSHSLLSAVTSPVAQVDGQIPEERIVVEEVALDHLALVAERDDELVEAVLRVVLHDVPEDRLAADLDHGLGLDAGLLGKSGAESSGKDDCLHMDRPWCRGLGISEARLLRAPLRLCCRHTHEHRNDT